MRRQEYFNFKRTSLFDRLHQVTGHSGVQGMQWHRHNSLNAKYLDSDENKYRNFSHQNLNIWH